MHREHDSDVVPSSIGKVDKVDMFIDASGDLVFVQDGPAGEDSQMVTIARRLIPKMLARAQQMLDASAKDFGGPPPG